MKMFAPLMFLGLAACAGSPSVETPAPADMDPALIAQGRTVAVAECSRCHGLDGISQSPNSDAPPMSELLGRYDADMLASDLIDGIRVGHDEMPEFDLSVATADALVGYLKSLRR